MIEQKKMIFSKLVDDKWLPDDYNEIKLPDFGFQLDHFQKQGVYLLDKKKSIFVAAHTSSGKTLLAHFSILKALSNNQKVIYTSPIKALSNQKYFEFRKLYCKKQEIVGIVTGDVQINEDAPILIMTTEILRNRLFKNTVDNLGYVIFDEIHYLNDKERGVVWEECIIQLQKDVCLLFLSATISNPLEFSEWVGRIKNYVVYVIKTDRRVIPLNYILFKNEQFFDLNGNQITEYTDYSKKKIIQMQKQNEKKVVSRKKFSLTLFLQKIRSNSFPTIFFCFSRNKCEEYMHICSSTSFIQIADRRKIENFMNIHKINSEYKKYWLKGIAVHHAGLLPSDKEVVEILFQKNLIKILFATETMAMGLNMPAKSVVFLSPFKRGKLLLTTPFLQMSGRAGRRGLDKEGKVFINVEQTGADEIKKVIHGRPEPLISSFKITFNLILMLIKCNLEIPKYLKSSFGELTAQRIKTPDFDRKIELEKQMSNLEINEKDNIIEVVKLMYEIKSGDFLNSCEWVVSYSGECGYVSEIIGNEIFLKNKNSKLKDNSSQSLQKERHYFKIPFIDNLVLTDTLKLNKKDILIVGSGEISFDNAIKHLKSCQATSHTIGLKLLQNLKNLELLKTKNQFLHQKMEKSILIAKYQETIKRYNIEEELRQINFRLGDESIILKSEYESRIKFLQDFQYIKNTSLLIKGQVASEIRTLNDIIITEMLFNNDFEELKGEEILSIFSCMICNEREIIKKQVRIKDITHKYCENDEETKTKTVDMKFLDELEKHVHEISIIYNEYNINESIELNYSAVRPVYFWCLKNEINFCTENEITKGGFVRVILRIFESVREIQTICKLIQNDGLFKKIEAFESILLRDVVCQESLYLKKESVIIDE